MRSRASQGTNLYLVFSFVFLYPEVSQPHRFGQMIKGGFFMSKITLNSNEQSQFQELLHRIRLDVPNNPRPARSHIPLIRGRVCVYLNQEINAVPSHLPDIRVKRTAGQADEYYHI